MEVEEGRRQLVEEANIAAEIFLTPLFVLPFPLQVALSVQLQAASLICMLSIQATS